MAYDLAGIRTKIRRLTKSPTTTQISDVQIDEYINAFYLFDLPESLQDFKQTTVLKFFTAPNVDIYNLSVLPVMTEAGTLITDVLNNYITFAPPVYIAGYQSKYYESREEFYRYFPQVNTQQKIATASAAIGAGPYAGIITNIPIVRGSITISAKGAAGGGLTYTQIAAKDNGTGGWINPITGLALVGTINYMTGAYAITFAAVPVAGTDINAEYLTYVASRPYALLYNNSQFILRPVPDQVYPVTIEAVLRPTAFTGLDPLVHPELNQYWEYIAYGASRKILLDRLDVETVALIEPEFKRQEMLVGRRQIVQQTTQRSATIYTNALSFTGDNYNNSGIY